MCVSGGGISSLEEGSVLWGSEGGEPSWSTPLYRINQLSQFGDTNGSVFHGIVGDGDRWGKYSTQDVASVLESFEEEVGSFVIANCIF